MCHHNKWDCKEPFYDHPCGFLNKSGESSGFFKLSACAFYSTNAIFLLVSATICPMILPEQEVFLERVFEIPFEERSWKKLVNLDTFHNFCVGPIPSEEAKQLNRVLRVRKCFCSSLLFRFSLNFPIF